MNSENDPEKISPANDDASKSDDASKPVIPIDKPSESAKPNSREADSATATPEPARKANITAGFEALLKNPSVIIASLKSEPGYHTALKLAGTALVCLLGFGFVIGTMSGGHQLWAAPLKVSGGVLACALICLPSLYIFACLTGLDLRPGALAGLLAAGVCLSALLLVGFAPVAWLFAQSTDSTLFYGILCLIFWGIALYFGFGLIRQTAELFDITKRHHLYIWASIFALVTIQMSTSLRPIVGTAETFLPEEKRFFLEHWFQQVNDAGKGTAHPKDSKVASESNDDDGWR